MPSAPTGREDGTLVQLSRDSPNAGEPLGPQVIHDGPQVCRALLRVCLHRSDRLLVANLLASERSCAVRITKLHAACLGGDRGKVSEQAKPSTENSDRIAPESALADMAINWLPKPCLFRRHNSWSADFLPT
jgi:hypothetical protein